MSLAELAGSSQCSSQLIHHWESGRSTPTRQRLERVCAVLGLDVEFIARGVPLRKSQDSKNTSEVRFTRDGYAVRNRAAYGDELRAAVAAAGFTFMGTSKRAGLHKHRVARIIDGSHKPNHADAEAIRAALSAPGLWPHVTEDTHMGRPRTRKRDEHRPLIERGSVWRRKGRAVKVERDAEAEDVVYYRVLGKTSDGELMQCAASMFLQRYAVV
jgi:hypothetical protein